MNGDRTDAPPSGERLRWQCRRGMLELDYVLARYLDEQYPSADERERRDFVRLLRQEDQDLYLWVIHGKPPADPSLAPIIRRVRGF